MENSDAGNKRTKPLAEKVEVPVVLVLLLSKDQGDGALRQLQDQESVVDGILVVQSNYLPT
jgi:hypothetical protein